MNKELNTEELKAKIKRLESELADNERSKKSRNKKLFWMVKKGFGIFTGPRLKKAIKQGIDQYKNNKEVSSETISNISSGIIYRLTRIGIFGAIITGIPIVILIIQAILLNIQNTKIDNQNELITHQNTRLDQQTYLQEANRRSSLVFLFSNVMDAIDRELKDEQNNPDRNLSKQLIGRIVSLSKSLKPYKYLNNDSLTRLISPERSQLFVNLISADLSDSTYKDIFNNGNFTYLELDNLTISDISFERVILDFSVLKNVSFEKCNFTTVFLNNIISKSAYFESCTFSSLHADRGYFEGVLLDIVR